ncbi:TorF family putative porin [Stakelama sp. CBK3Z-3]|uniref:TorF family putative porin n=1 Tax=Stakelama flava TaxID=2860338 RepID=A0ABS6XLC2_9SPHN|nr:TorF family putative porin [Stakelama flava]MBW4330613.1 TorF family putative porin [Stakelama flava]
MRFTTMLIAGTALLATATPALAQDTAPPSPITVSGGATLVSDYRFRGFTQNGENAAIQGTLNINSDTGFYVGTWASSINFAGNTEVDLYGGYSTEVSPGITVDAGLLYYLYPKHGNYDTDFFEPYLNLSGTLGPLEAKVGVNYAWEQSAISDYSSVYVHGDVSTAIPNTPVSLNGHIGYAKSDSFLGGLDGDVMDYSIGATTNWKMLTLGISYVNTDAPESVWADGNNYKEDIGADGAVIFSIGASF